MTRKARVFIVLALVGACLFVAAFAWASQSAAIHASFTPNRLGAATNLSATATFTSNTATLPPPVTKLTAFVPAGVHIDTRGASTCTAQELQQQGASGCPVTSRGGFGGGVALLELGKEVIHEPFTLDIFLAPSEHGHLAFLAYLIATAPASVELVLKAREIPAPKPYGFGFSVEVPPIPTIPGASDASIESAYFTFGSTNVAYYETVHGKRKLVHINGLIEPRSCPRGGFPLETIVDFADSTTTTATTTIPCPGNQPR
jgi:hypothetical protein